MFVKDEGHVEAGCSHCRGALVSGKEEEKWAGQWF